MRPWLLVPACVVLVVGACTNDFDQFEGDGVAPDADGGTQEAGPNPGPDGGTDLDAAFDADPPLDAGPDAPVCTGRAQCLSTGDTCGKNCRAAAATCTNGCQNGNPGDACRATCASTSTSCQANCTTTCNNCLTTAGCPQANVCQNAVN